MTRASYYTIVATDGRRHFVRIETEEAYGDRQKLAKVLGSRGKMDRFHIGTCNRAVVAWLAWQKNIPVAFIERGKQS